MRPIVLQFHHIHTAIGGELLKLEAHAAGLDPGDAASVAGFAGHLGMIEAILNIHSRDEDGAVFPTIDQRFPGMMEPYSLDHEEEHRLMDAILADLSRLQQPGGDDRAGAARSLHRDVVAVTEHLTHHMRKEEAHPYTRFSESLSEEEELGFVARALSAIPEAALAQSMPWRAGYLTNEQLLLDFAVWERVLTPEKARAFIAPLKTGLAPERWSTLVAARPAIAAYS